MHVERGVNSAEIIRMYDTRLEQFALLSTNRRQSSDLTICINLSLSRQLTRHVLASYI